MTTSTNTPLFLECPHCAGVGRNHTGYRCCPDCWGTGCLITTGDLPMEVH